MAQKTSNSLSRLGCLKQFLLILAIICGFFGLMLIENEKRIFKPRPKAVSYWIQFSKKLEISNSTNSSNKGTRINRPTSKSSPKPTVPSPTHFNYQKTKQWGKQDKKTWQTIYGDLDCPDNSRRAPLTAILKKWIEITKKHNIEYAFYWGSLLGIVRNNDVVPWDHDMDLLVHYKDILVLEKLGWPRNIHEWDGNTYINAIPSSEHNKSMDDRNRWNCQGKAVSSHVDLCSIQEPLVRLYNNGAFLDVFHFFDFGDSIVTTPEGHRAEISKKDFYPLRPCLFMGVETWCPNNPFKLLSSWYGPDFFKSVKKCKKGRWL